MATKDRYSVNKTCVYNLGYHLIWCTKYRRKVLSPKIELRLKELIRKKAEEIEVEIEEMETMPDYIHIFVKSNQHTPHTFLSNSLRDIPHAYYGKNLRNYGHACRHCGHVHTSASLSVVFPPIP